MCERFTIAAAGMASYDPSFDTGGRVLHTAIAGAGKLTGPTSPTGYNGSCGQLVSRYGDF